MRERRYRRKINIIINILEISKNGAKKTRIMYLANLSYTQLKRYLDLLIKEKFLEYEPIKREYKTSNKGLAFLADYYEIKELVDEVKSL